MPGHLIRTLVAGLGIALLSPTVSADAVDRWLEAAKQGNPSMQFALGHAYASGSTELGIAADSEQALEWYRRAAERGHVESQYVLGHALETGRFSRADKKTARAWYQRAAGAGHRRAQQALARLNGKSPARPGPTHQTSLPTNLKGANQPVSSPVAGRAINPSAPAAPSVTPQGITDKILAALQAPNNSYWVWWQGALALGLITIGFWYLVGVPLGVSSSYGTLVAWREAEERAAVQSTLDQASQSEILDAMMAETMAEFGEAAFADIPDLAVMAGGTHDSTPASGDHKLPTPWPVHLTFLGMTAVGGMLAAFLSGDFALRYDMGQEFKRLFGGGISIWGVLFFAGTLIGFGVRLGGGCTSGHGLSGVSRLQPGSLLGTASFFCAAIAASYAMEWLL